MQSELSSASDYQHKLELRQIGSKAALNAPAAAEFIGVSIRRFFELAKTPDFPRARSLGGPRSRRWLVLELLDFLASRPAAEQGEPEHLRKVNEERRAA